MVRQTNAAGLGHMVIQLSIFMRLSLKTCMLCLGFHRSFQMASRQRRETYLGPTFLGKKDKRTNSKLIMFGGIQISVEEQKTKEKTKRHALVQDRTGDLRISILLPGMSYVLNMRPTS
jgi:hypothetical protein